MQIACPKYVMRGRSPKTHSSQGFRFLRTLPVAVDAGAAFFAAAFLAVAPATPLLMLPITPPAFLAGAIFLSAAFVPTVDVPLSLVSLMPLILR